MRSFHCLLGVLALGTMLPVASSCVVRSDAPAGTARIMVKVAQEDGSPLPGANNPYPVDTGNSPRRFQVELQAELGDGSPDPSYNGYVRLSVHPGTITQLDGEDVAGRNVLLKAGTTKTHVVQVSMAHGETRLWAEDVGYVPADPAKPPACSDGKDNDGDGLTDFPADPGCAFANDDTETGGSYATGVSPAMWFAMPRLSDVQGHGASTPYSSEQVQVATADPAKLIVTRISTDGFYVTDITDTTGYNHLYAFNFSTPWGMRVCDRITYLAGTLSEFYGFTELGFPSYEINPWYEQKGPCEVPEPTVITAGMLGDKANAVKYLEPLESGLVRLQGARIGAHFGPEKVDTNKPAANASNCDLNGDGKVDYTAADEGACSEACVSDPECSEWNSYQAHSGFRVVVLAASGYPDQLGMQANLDTVTGFDAYRMKGALITATGTLRHFSGGTLNWTLEARCSDDLVYCAVGDTACEANPPAPKPMSTACVQKRTDYDPNEGTN